MNEYFEKIAAAAFQDELEKIAGLADFAVRKGTKLSTASKDIIRKNIRAHIGMETKQIGAVNMSREVPRQNLVADVAKYKKYMKSPTALKQQIKVMKHVEPTMRTNPMINTKHKYPTDITSYNTKVVNREFSHDIMKFKKGIIPESRLRHIPGFE